MDGSLLNYHGDRVNMQSQPHTQTPEFSNFLWEQIYNEIKRKVDTTTFNSWFRNLQFISVYRDTLEIAVPSKFTREWIRNNYIDMITNIARYFKPEINIINIKVKNIKRVNKASDDEEVVQHHVKDDYYDNISSKLNPSFTLENFVVGDYNKIAVKSAQNLLYSKKSMTNSGMLYMHSKVGMGKTHLLQALTFDVNTKASNSKPQAIYFSAEKFMNQYVYACRKNQLSEFRKYINRHNIFVIDDIQFICGKVSTQQELIRCIISFIEHNKKVIVSGDCSPFGLSMEKRFISRLNGGMVVQIQDPDYQTKLKIIQHKLKILNEKISSDVLEFIAENITDSVRELEGALFKIISHKNILEKDITLKCAKKILEEHISANHKDVSFDLILQKVASYYNVELSDILSKSRLKKFVYPRQIVALLAKQLTRDSLQEIGDKLGGRDHATIIYSITKLEDQMPYDSNIKKDVANLMKVICN